MRTLTFAGAGLTTLLALAANVHAHVSLDTPMSRYYQTSARQADQAKQKSAPCGSSGDSRTTNTSLITRFQPGETIVVSWRETVQHPGHFRIAFDEDGQDFSLPGEAPAADVVILADDIADKSGSNGVSYSQEVTLPNVECDRCTLQLIQVMTTAEPPYRASDLYFNCADLVLAAAGGASSTNPPAGGAGGMGVRTTAGGNGGTDTRGASGAGGTGAGGTGARTTAGGALSVSGSGDNGGGGRKSSAGGSVSSSNSADARNQGGSSAISATRTTLSLGNRSGASSKSDTVDPDRTMGGAAPNTDSNSGGAEDAASTSHVDAASGVTSGNPPATETPSGCTFHTPAAHKGQVFTASSLLALAWLAWRSRRHPRFRARASGGDPGMGVGAN